MAEDYRSLNLVEILEELQNGDLEDIDIRDIFIEPPDPNINSEEDSAEEDEGGTIDNLTSRQLLANAEVVLSNCQRIGFGSDLQMAFDDMSVDLPNPNGDDDTPDEQPEDDTIIHNNSPMPSCSNQSSAVENESTPTCPSTLDSSPTLRSVKDTPSPLALSGRTSRKRKHRVQSQEKNVRKKNFCDKSINKKKKAKNQASKDPIRKWKKEAFLGPAVQPFPESDFSKYSDFSPIELFELFFDEELFQMMLEEIKRYASFKNVADPNIRKEELKCFLAILIVSGYNSLPGKRFYWETSDDVKNILISNSMRRNRFIQIMSLLHFADNTKMDNSDKLWKLRPLIDKLKTNFRHNFVPVCQLDFDESMIAYYGRHSCKQFLRGKPIRFGYKAWCLNTFSGYLVDFIIYQGKAGAVNEYDKSFGKAAAPLVRILDDLVPNKEAPYHIYFDNLFTSLNLLVYLRNKNIHGTGTIRANRVPEQCKLIVPKEIKKKERGFYDYCVSDDNILIVRWQDNAPVTVASTIHGIEPVTNVKRYSRTEKKTISVKRPLLIGEYNKFMGGTELMDENVNRYRIAIRSKKWWWPIFSWSLDVSLQNAWYLYNMSRRPKISQLDFKRQVAVQYLKTFGTEPQCGGRPAARPQSTPAFEQVQYDGLNHLVFQNDGNKKRRCAGQDCKSIIRTSCKKCGVGLCIPCFMPFHTKK